MLSRHQTSFEGRKYRKIAEAHSKEGALNIRRAFLSMGYPSVKIKHISHKGRWNVYILVDRKYR